MLKLVIPLDILTGDAVTTLRFLKFFNNNVRRHIEVDAM